MGLSLREAAERMASLQLPRSEAHAWWTVAEALVAVLDSGNEEAIEIANKTYMERMKE